MAAHSAEMSAGDLADPSAASMAVQKAETTDIGTAATMAAQMADSLDD